MNPNFRSSLPVVSLCLLAGPFISITYAGRGIPIPVIWGHGETVAMLGKLEVEVYEAFVQKEGRDLRVGYLYSRFHIFYVDLWTWNGRYVLSDGTQYLEPDESQWRQLLGNSVHRLFNKPFGYRYPPGAIVLVVIALLSAWVNLADMLRPKRHPVSPAPLAQSVTSIDTSLRALDRPPLNGSSDQ